MVFDYCTNATAFHGAYFAGSINWLPDDATLSPTSDLDLMVVLTDAHAPTKLGKFLCRGVLLDVTYLAKPGYFYFGDRNGSIVWDPDLGILSPTVRFEKIGEFTTGKGTVFWRIRLSNGTIVYLAGEGVANA